MNFYRKNVTARIEQEGKPPLLVEVDVRFNLDAMAAELCSRATTNDGMKAVSAHKGDYIAAVCKKDRAKLRAWRRLNGIARGTEKTKVTIEQPA